MGSKNVIKARNMRNRNKRVRPDETKEEQEARRAKEREKRGPSEPDLRAEEFKKNFPPGTKFTRLEMKNEEDRERILALKGEDKIRYATYTAPDFDICGATTKYGTPCFRRAGMNTDHIGTGRCNLHGGTDRTPANNWAHMLGNEHRLTHGLDKSFLPEEVEAIVGNLDGADMVTMQWNAIKLQWTAILRSQKIMFVTDKDDTIKMVKKDTDTMDGSSVEYEIHTSWDRQERFMLAQSKAFQTLNAQIEQFTKMVNELEYKDEQEQVKLDKLKLEKDKLDQQIKILKGIGNEIEDLSEYDESIYGDDVIEGVATNLITDGVSDE